MKKFLSKYNQLKNFYLLNEATEQETIYTRFLASIGQVKPYIDQLIDQYFQSYNLTNVDVYDVKSKEVINTNINISFSNHLIYGFAARSSTYCFDILKTIYTKKNKTIYKNNQHSLFNCPIDNVNMPAVCNDYIISKEQIDMLQNGLKRSAVFITNKIKNIFPIIISNDYGIYTKENKDYKVLLTKSHCGMIFHINIYQNQINVVFGTAYPDYSTTLLDNKYYHNIIINRI